MNQLTEDEFDDKFTLVTNTIEDSEYYNEERFGTDTRDWMFLRSKPIEHVWTVLEGDEGTYITTGIHKVNSLYYVVTEEPCHQETEVELWAGD